MADNPGFVDDVSQTQSAEGEKIAISEEKETSASNPNDQVYVNIDAAQASEKANGSQGTERGNLPVMDLPPTKPYAGMGKEDLLRFSETPFWNRFRMVCLIIFWLGWLALLGAVIGLTIVAPRCSDPPQPTWWQRSTFYQVYLRSFQDTDGDGIGDIAGLTNKLNYIDDLNVGAIVLSSIFESSDGGDLDQEITNHTVIDDVYGTMQDFETLLERVHELGMKLILEFIPNHTGREHQWFVASRADPDPSNQYWNYYIWSDCPSLNPVNNWRSVFGGSAWTEGFGQSDRCYLHQMSENQPDLNLRSGRVRGELDDIMLFWLEKGVDGFRINNVQLLYEDSDLRNDSQVEGCDDTNEPYECLDHQYSSNQPEIHDIIAHWRSLLNEFGERTGAERILLTDAVASINETGKYYGTLGHTGAHLPFNYALRSYEENDKLEEPEDNRLWAIIHQWLTVVPEAEIGTWAMASQDRSRMTFVDSGDDLQLRAFNVLQMTLPGVAISYYGEEIGMKNGNTSDAGVLGDRVRYRTPMQWDSSENAGFSNMTNGAIPDDPWTPVNADYLTINVETLRNESESGMNTLSLYRSLSSLRRRQQALQYGAFQIALVDSKVFSFVRDHEGKDRIMVVVNMGDEEVTENFSKELSLIPDTGETVLTTHPESKLTAGQDKNLRSIPLQPLEAAVFRWAYSR